MNLKPKARIIGIGAYLPERIFTNAEFEKIVETTDEWITSRTGIKERRIAAIDEYTSDMGVKAAKKALTEAGITIHEIDLILVATMSPDYVSSSTACIIQSKLSANHIPSLDIQAACSGYLYVLATAKAYIESGMYSNVLVIAAEKLSSYTDYQDRSTCVIFGDGAAASIVSNKGPGFAIDAVTLGADGGLVQLFMVPAGGTACPTSSETVNHRKHYFKMEGKELFKHAVRRMSEAAKKCMEKINLTEEDIDWIIPHQANLRIIKAVAKGFNVPEDRVYKAIHKHGNTAAASIPLAFDDLVRTHLINTHEHILLVAFGAGLTWGAAILTKIDS